MLNVFEEFCLEIKKRIISGKEGFLLSDLVENIKRLREENGIEEKNPSLQLSELWKEKL